MGSVGLEKTRYRIYLNTDRQGKTNWIHITCSFNGYPTCSFNGYPELNVNLVRFGKYAEVEIYLACYVWSGAISTLICKTMLKDADDIFQIIDANQINDNNVRDIVLSIFKKLKQYLQVDSCYNAVYYFSLYSFSQ